MPSVATHGLLLPLALLGGLFAGCAREGRQAEEQVEGEYGIDPRVARLFEPIPEEAPAPEDIL